MNLSEIEPEFESLSTPGIEAWYELSEMLFLGFVLAGGYLIGEGSRYLSNPHLVISVEILFPGWMLGWSVFWMRRRKIGFGYFRHSRRPALQILLLLAYIGFFVTGLKQSNPPGFINFPLIYECWMIFQATIVWPIVEEIFFRGLLLDHLKRNFGWALAMLIVSVLFGLQHITQGFPMRFFETFLISVIACWMAIGFRSLILPISYHCIINTNAMFYSAPPELRVFTIALSALFMVILIAVAVIRRCDPWVVEEHDIRHHRPKDSFTWK